MLGERRDRQGGVDVGGYHRAAEGPPRPFGAEPPPGAEPVHTGGGLTRAQNRALLVGPFPHGGLTRGVSEGTLLLDEAAQVRGLAMTRIRETGSATVRIPVDWRDFVAAAPPAGFDASDPADPAYRFARLDGAQLGKRTGARRRARPAAGQMDLPRSAPPVGRGSGARRLAVPGRSLSRPASRTPTGGTIEYQRPAGLYSAGVGGDPASALPKPFLGGFTFPFDPLRVDRGHVRVWALLMGPGQAVVLQQWGRSQPQKRPRRQGRLRRRGAAAWRTIARLHAGDNGVLNVQVPLAGAARLRLESGALRSASAVVPSRRSAL